MKKILVILVLLISPKTFAQTLFNVESFPNAGSLQSVCFSAMKFLNINIPKEEDFNKGEILDIGQCMGYLQGFIEGYQTAQGWEDDAKNKKKFCYHSKTISEIITLLDEDLNSNPSKKLEINTFYFEDFLYRKICD